MPIKSRPISDDDARVLAFPYASRREIDPSIRLVPADSFNIEQLTAAYNQTRVDYLVPMPMNASRLAEYIHVYDIDLPRSLVAVDGDQILGLGMLGVRSRRAWITRLGVLPVKRRRGTGEILMRGLLAAAQQCQCNPVILEVIKNNTPAHMLFRKLGFRETRELPVLRRPPSPPVCAAIGQTRRFDQSGALALLASRSVAPAWTNETDSFANASDISGLGLTLADGGRGWLVFQHQRFILSRLVLHTEQGDPVRVGRALLAYLYQHFPDFDTHAENIPADDPHLPAMLEAGFVESFRRIEMHLQ